MTALELEARKRVALPALLEACKEAHAACLLPRSIIAVKLERAIKILEPDWTPTSEPVR